MPTTTTLTTLRSMLQPVELFQALAKRPYTFFLDGECDNARLGRYSFLGSDPFLVLSAKAERVELRYADGRVARMTADPLTVLDGLLRRYRRPSASPALPFAGGCVGYFGYDLKDRIEAVPDRSRDDLGIPDCIVGLYDTVAAYDRLTGSWHLAGGRGAAAERLATMLASYRIRREDERSGRCVTGAVRSNMTKAAYCASVRAAKRYISRGDIYQVNLSQRFEADLAIPPNALYRRLRTVSPAPFSSYLGFDGIAIASSSPERFLRKDGTTIETCPIKGTRPRGKDRVGDRRMERALARSAKDAAEHIMIVDLERNDLGRVCRFGSVRPAGEPAIERYANVFHLVSTVAGTARPRVTPVDILRATFPGGSITGAPKIRAMEIIEELEPVKRSVYTGAIGYIGFDGALDLSIAIRTFIIKGKKAYFSVGGGIVADSDPLREYEETLHKARGMFAALGVTTVIARSDREANPKRERRSNLG